MALVVLLAATWLLSGALVATTDPLAVAAGRATTSFLGLLMVAAARTATRRPALDVMKHGRRAAMALGSLGVFGYSVASIWAIRLVGATTTNVVLALLPCATFLLGAVLFRQRPGRVALAGTCLAVTAAVAYGFLDSGRGLGIRGDASGGRTVLGVLTALAAVGCMALYAHYYNRLAAGSSSLVTLPAVFGAGALMLLLPALTLNSFGQVTPAQWGGLLLLGCGIYVPAYIIQHELLLRRGPLFTTSMALTVPFVVRVCTWGIGQAGPPSPFVLGLLIACCIGVRLTLAQPRGLQARTPRP
ncbi:DMT family transporter [Streptomyces sp. 110]|uniref:DMT family transporter n=1 Tax=Streptomyces endocoffeicus TaxID=2898945 RepID=A0ABS1Q2A4_9ACTN|nr:EamA family transporter [Streptomyces endocoffeicus]MBL1118390.1 DMT family transporter [Streptomyces endocoffeicus]